MDKLHLPEKSLPYISALRGLIRTGAAASPTLESSLLIDLPAVWQRCTPSASSLKRSHVFIKLLHHVITQRFEGKDSETALILFGYDRYAGVPIQDRYRAVAKLYNPHWTWENYRKEPLLRHLLLVYLALEREAELASTAPLFGSQPQPAQHGLIGQDWVLESFEGFYNFPAQPGQPLEIVQTRRLRASSNGATVWQHSAFWRERGVSSIPQIALFGPGTASVTDTHLDPTTGMRVFVTKVQFPQPIAYGQVVEFTLVKRVDVHHEQLVPLIGRDWFGLNVLASPAEHIKIGLQFPGKRPQKVWRHENIISGLTRSDPHTSENQLAIDNTGFVSHTWSDASAGLSYGISLEW